MDKIRVKIEAKAESCDPVAMVAYALMRVADAGEQLAQKVDALGFNDGCQPKGSPGTTEEIAMQLKSMGANFASLLLAMEAKGK